MLYFDFVEKLRLSLQIAGESRLFYVMLPTEAQWGRLRDDQIDEMVSRLDSCDWEGWPIQNKRASVRTEWGPYIHGNDQYKLVGKSAA